MHILILLRLGYYKHNLYLFYILIKKLFKKKLKKFGNERYFYKLDKSNPAFKSLSIPIK